MSEDRAALIDWKHIYLQAHFFEKRLRFKIDSNTLNLYESISSGVRLWTAEDPQLLYLVWGGCAVLGPDVSTIFCQRLTWHSPSFAQADSCHSHFVFQLTLSLECHCWLCRNGSHWTAPNFKSGAVSFCHSQGLLWWVLEFPTLTVYWSSL